MFVDEEDSKPKPKPKDLTILSVEALRDYIEQLKAEISRTEAEIEKKKGVRQGAESLFKK